MAVPNGEILHLIPLRNGRQVIFILRNLAKHRVDKTGGLSPAGDLRQLHGGVHRGAVRHPIQIQDLVSAQTQNFQQRRLEMIRLLGAVRAEVKVQQQLVLNHAVNKAAAQRRLRPNQTIPAQLSFQGSVCPCVVIPAGRQNPQGCFPRAHQSRLLPRLLRPRKISTYRSSCSADISRAAT